MLNKDNKTKKFSPDNKNCIKMLTKKVIFVFFLTVNNPVHQKNMKNTYEIVSQGYSQKTMYFSENYFYLIKMLLRRRTLFQK